MTPWFWLELIMPKVKSSPREKAGARYEKTRRRWALAGCIAIARYAFSVIPA
jgi:hypothetical protein